MSGIIEKLQGPTAAPDEQLRVLDVEGEETDDVLDALSSDTSRALFRELFEEPGPPSEIAERVDTSVQNVNYHLTNLQDAGLVEAIDTRYSEKGNEMNVYGPAADPIVLIGDAAAANPTALRDALADWATGVATLALVSVAVQLAFDRLVGTTGTGFFEPSALGAADWPGGAAFASVVASPGVLFFVGGLVVLTAAVASQYRS